MRLRVLSFVVAFGLLAAMSAMAAGETVPLYTNADIAKLEPLPTQKAPISGETEGPGWGYVAEWVTRERDRLAREQQQALERRRYEDELERSRRPSYGMAYAPYGYGYPFGFDDDVCKGRGCRGQQIVRAPNPAETVFTLHMPTGGTITPLHARPARTLVPPGVPRTPFATSTPRVAHHGRGGGRK